ncbi:MAG: hypothetical protein CW338_10760, partial [Clostridiales bacterium]|nr:hypothetical protein [Clostridiales bacterium]
MTRNRLIRAAVLLLALLLFCQTVFAEGGDVNAAPCSAARPANLKITEDVMSGATVLKNYRRKFSVIAPDPDEYAYANNGIFTFRGDNFRRNAACGNAQITTGRMEVIWSVELGGLNTESGMVYGVGWGSQPAVIRWDTTVRGMMNLYPGKKDQTALREVIFAAQDGKVYFLDLLTGEATRDVINVGYPLKGSVTVDTQSRPVIAFGQAVSKLKKKTGGIGYYFYDLIDQSQLLFLNGRANDKQKQYASNGAFDGTGLFLYQSDTFVVAGENGLLYTITMNTDFDRVNGTLAIAEDIVYLKSKAKAQKDARTSMESSVAMYDRYIYAADSYGIVKCVDSDTMSIIWAVDCGDNTDAAIALDQDENGAVALYTGNTAYERLGKKNDVTIRRLNALTGEEVWNYRIKCAYDKSELSGCKASPVIGQHAISDLVIFTVNMTGDGKTSSILALDKNSGEVRWQTELETTAVSSPVAVYNRQGNAWIIQGDESGILHLLDGRTGIEISAL